MTWIDWAQAVPIGTILYCLGLYEYNTHDIWPSFFVIDRSKALKSGFTYTAPTLLSSAWSAKCIYSLLRIWHDTLGEPTPKYTGNSFSSYHGSDYPRLRPLVDFCFGIYHRLGKIVMAEFWLAGLELGVFALVLALKQIARALLNPHQPSRWNPAQRWPRSVLSGSSLRVVRTIINYTIHISIHLYLINILILLILLWAPVIIYSDMLSSPHFETFPVKGLASLAAASGILLLNGVLIYSYILMIVGYLYVTALLLCGIFFCGSSMLEAPANYLGT
ncbi:hypothetical protein CVT26_014552 [Gymnopilus dilepis]|uniref:Uncharacterized protein n=1 Tax=Gymnopilus dilepis TaxID=231916 RepID=A0A409VVK0_9AGAR|nr:hypothetical protein CVT26_014552 [Gymnopilus dilepis]